MSEIKVHFEVPRVYGFHVATFHCEHIYNEMLPHLEHCARKRGYTVVTESLGEL